MKKLFCLPLLLIGLFSNISAGDDEKDAKKTEAESVSLSGRFEAIDAVELKAGTEQVASLTLKKIVPHGTRVKKGRAIIWFDTEAIDKQLDESEVAHRKSELTMRDLELELKQLATLSALDRDAAKRAHQRAKQDYDNYVRVLKNEQLESADSSLKFSQYSLDNAMEELKQLEQMYQEDELTEESEEIVLKRAKRAVESAQLRLKHAKTANSRFLNQSLPRESLSKKEQQEREELAYDKTLLSLEIKRIKREIEIEVEKQKHKKAGEDLKELRQDRRQLVVTSPQDGTVYHGAMPRGKLSEKPSALKEGSTVTSKQVLATVVRPKMLQIRIELPEKEFGNVKVGDKGVVKATAFPDTKIHGTIKSISTIPMSAGKFDSVMSLKLGKNAPPVVAGMTCTIEIQSK